MKKNDTYTPGFKQRRRTASRRSTTVTTVATVTLLLGSLMLPGTAEAKPSREGADVQLQRQRGRMPENWVDLTATGKRLEAEYADRLAALESQIRETLPAFSSEQHEAFVNHLSALASKQDAILNINKRLRRFKDYDQALENFQSAERAMAEAPKVVADMQRFKEYALALPDNHEDKEWVMEDAERLLEYRIRDLEKNLPKRLEKAKAELEAASNKKGELAAQKAELQASVADEEKALDQLRAEGMKVLGDAGLAEVLASNKLDAVLAQFMVLKEADPYWLAVYAQQGPEYVQRIERLLENTPLMLRMLVADGATFGKYGKAMENYEAIRQASPRASEGHFERLALAVSLEHAQPIAAGIAGQDAHGGPWDENTVWIDPVARYLEYEKAWLNGELDPDFDKHDVWSLRMVVDGYQTGEYLSWGRRMLRDYRPDLVHHPVDALRYSKAVDEEIHYTAKFLDWGNKLGWDRDDLERMQNALANGGICGRRAHFGGYILNAFGVPTAARGQRGHAALVRYTPAGWVPYLGAGWGSSNREVRGYRSDTDFRSSTEARRDPNAFLLVKRAQWIGWAMGEAHAEGWGYQNAKRWKKNPKQATPPEPWHAVSCIVQEGIIDRLDPKVLDAIAEDLGESDEPLEFAVDGEHQTMEIPAAERRITVDHAGVIHIPAAACTHPSTNTENILFMPSNLGGFQMHFRRYGRGDSFEYTVDAPRAGKYALSARLVTPAWKQKLDLTINDAAQPIKIDLPYTKGLWGELEPVVIELKRGTNELSFSRMHHYFRGVSIRDFKLTPVQ